MFDWYYEKIYYNSSIKIERPEYVFATIPIQTHVDANDILDRISEDFIDCDEVDLREHISSKTFNKVQDSLKDLRNEINNNCVYYEQDVNNIIVIPWEK